MENNHWEEQGMNQRISSFHEDQMEKMKLPPWMLRIKCPFCEKPIPKRAIRNIQLCFNTRNFGEMAVEVLCEECSKMDTVYFRTKIENLSEFKRFLTITSDGFPATPPILEEDMFKMNYNNIVESMLGVQTPSEEK